MKKEYWIIILWLLTSITTLLGGFFYGLQQKEEVVRELQYEKANYERDYVEPARKCFGTNRQLAQFPFGLECLPEGWAINCTWNLDDHGGICLRYPTDNYSGVSLVRSGE